MRANVGKFDLKQQGPALLIVVHQGTRRIAPLLPGGRRRETNGIEGWGRDTLNALRWVISPIGLFNWR